MPKIVGRQQTVRLFERIKGDGTSGFAAVEVRNRMRQRYFG